MRRWIPITAAILAGCDPATLGLSARKTTGYELDAKTEIKQGGMRAYAETVYTYYAVAGGAKRELWRLTRHDRYLRHWISPSGRLWVMTSGMPGPGGAATLWTRDPSGNGYGPWGYENFLPPVVRGTQRYAQGSADGIDLDRVVALTLGRSGSSEGLRMPLKGGGEARVTLVAREHAAPIILARTLKDGEHDLVSEGLEASPYGDPIFTRPVERSPLAVWQYREEKTGRTRRILQTFQQSTYGDPVEGVILKVIGEREMDLAPALAVRTPAARVLWFGLSRLGEPEAARLTVMRYDGTVLNEVDLLKLGGYKSVTDLKARLAFGDVRVQRDGEWVPIDPEENVGTNSPEELEIRGDDARILVKIDEKGARIERLTGLAAKRPKETSWPGMEIIEERTFTSPNGLFRLRERRIKRNYPGRLYKLTLLGEGTEADGRKTPVELWSGVSSSPALQVRLTDSGRAFVFQVDPPYEKDPARPVLFIRDADGESIAGIDLFQTPALYKTAEEAERGLSLEKMSRVVKGELKDRIVDDVRVPTPATETYRLPLGPDRVWEFSIAPNPAIGGRFGMSWRTPTARP